MSRELDKKKSLKLSTFDRLISGIARRLPSWLLRYDHTYLVHSKGPKLITRDYTGYEVRYAGADDVGLMTRAGVDGQLFKHRLGRGDNCVLVLHQGRVVTWSWAATGTIFLKLSGVSIDLPPDSFFLYDIYTTPEERLKGFITTCFKYQLEHYRESNRTVIYGVIAASNTPSLKTHYRMGFELVGETYCLTILSIKFAKYAHWPFSHRGWHVYVKDYTKSMEWV